MTFTTPLSADEINDMFATACEYQNSLEYDRAKAIYLHMLTHVDGPLLRYNLGLVYFDLKEYTKATEQFKIGITMQPEDQDMLFNLAISQKASGDTHSAIASYLQLLELNDKHLDALYNLAGCYRENRETKAAIRYYELVLLHDPENDAATNNLAFTFHLTGDLERALYYYRQLLRLRPNHAPASHMIAALEGATPTQPPDEYIKEVFDNYSATYEESLTKKLDYSVPEQLRTVMDTFRGTSESFERGIDLGCGTGLSALAFQDVVKEFHGIDLSPKMIERAREKNIYTNLIAGNILNILQERIDHQPYDFILAADVFIYLGELNEFFETIRNCSSAHALFCFSTEKTASGRRYQLRPSGRYAHSRDYIHETLALNGWEVLVCKDADLRKEKGDWIQGDLWIASRI
ncbi:tetratricopeptide repeat protein [Desulfopila sp. IMCC35008]|uniref:tetratricopeptide repeat protein n=1 Tax=Desulfopila sp. IMCC35008 TaxID=2653858 RepID=UPI0013D3BA59|nr:tetratricopeptide repeat protein [Desulfopila sp. IMCC35008]